MVLLHLVLKMDDGPGLNQVDQHNVVFSHGIRSKITGRYFPVAAGGSTTTSNDVEYIARKGHIRGRDNTRYHLP